MNIDTDTHELRYSNSFSKSHASCFFHKLQDALLYVMFATKKQLFFIVQEESKEIHCVHKRNGEEGVQCSIRQQTGGAFEETRAM